MAPKRKSTALGLERRVRARREEEQNIELELNDQSSDEEAYEEDVRDTRDNDNDDDGNESASESESESDMESEPNAATTKSYLSSVSFGALARAQASMGPSKRKSKVDDDDTPATEQAKHSRATTKSEPKPKVKRSSKHAPQEQTSKKPVSRRREIVPDTRRQYRDPRFDPLVGGVDESKNRRAYAFLDDYRDSEMADLRVQIKKTKDPTTKEELKRQLMSMESKRKAQKKKEDEVKLLEEHRNHEKELVAQGKQPFYLKKSEQKKQLLTNRFSSMSKGQVDRAIERKRKKVAGKEKKELGFMERTRR